MEVDKILEVTEKITFNSLICIIAVGENLSRIIHKGKFERQCSVLKNQIVLLLLMLLQSFIC